MLSLKIFPKASPLKHDKVIYYDFAYERWIIDLTMLPKDLRTSEFKVLFVAIDHFSKFL